MNVKYEYLYRDAGNNKRWGEVVFLNNQNTALDEIDKQIRKILIDGEFFIADRAGLPVLNFRDYDKELDHDWYEYSSLALTNEPENDDLCRSIEEFLVILKHASTAS